MTQFKIKKLYLTSVYQHLDFDMLDALHESKLAAIDNLKEKKRNKKNNQSNKIKHEDATDAHALSQSSDKAIQIAIKINPNKLEVYFAKDHALDVLYRHEEAIKSHDQAIKIDPKNIEAYINKGNALIYLNRRRSNAK